MKKILISALGLLAVLGGLFAISTQATALTLSSCYSKIGFVFPRDTSIRAPLAAQYGIFFYKGTREQNMAFTEALCGSNNIGSTGFSVATGYQKTVRVPMSSSQTYVPVSSLQLKDGTYLSTSTLGTKIFLDLDPGGANEEITLCTDIDFSATNFTGCTRGLAFSGTSTAAVNGLAKSHNASTPVVLSNVHYVYEQFVDVNAKTQTIEGLKTVSSSQFLVGPGTAGNINIYFHKTNSTTTDPYIFWNGTKMGYSNDGASSFTFDAGSSGLTAGKGVTIGSSIISFNPAPSSTSGLGFKGSQAIVATSTGITTDNVGLTINTSSSINWQAPQTFSSTTRFNGNVTVSGTMNVDVVNVTSSTVSSTFNNITVNQIGAVGVTTTFVGNVQINGKTTFTTSSFSGVVGGGFISSVSLGANNAFSTTIPAGTHIIKMYYLAPKAGDATNGCDNSSFNWDILTDPAGLVSATSTSGSPGQSGGSRLGPLNNEVGWSISGTTLSGRSIYGCSSNNSGWGLTAYFYY